MNILLSRMNRLVATAPSSKDRRRPPHAGVRARKAVCLSGHGVSAPARLRATPLLLLALCLWWNGAIALRAGVVFGEDAEFRPHLHFADHLFPGQHPLDERQPVAEAEAAAPGPDRDRQPLEGDRRAIKRQNQASRAGADPPAPALRPLPDQPEAVNPCLPCAPAVHAGAFFCPWFPAGLCFHGSLSPYFRTLIIFYNLMFVFFLTKGLKTAYDILAAGIS